MPPWAAGRRVLLRARSSGARTAARRTPLNTIPPPPDRRQGDGKASRDLPCDSRRRADPILPSTIRKRRSGPHPAAPYERDRPWRPLLLDTATHHDPHGLVAVVLSQSATPLLFHTHLPLVWNEAHQLASAAVSLQCIRRTGRTSNISRYMPISYAITPVHGQGRALPE